MRTLAEQESRYQKFWEENSLTLGQKDQWKPDPVPLYTIGIWLPDSLVEKIKDLIDSLKAFLPQGDHYWQQPNECHITLAMPGRIGKHFQEEDIETIVSSLQEVCKNISPFSVSLGKLSCFSSVLFREIYSEGYLFKLHSAIAEKIPYDLHPQYRFENYNPHMSLLYAGEDATALIQNQEFTRDIGTLEMPISKIYFNWWVDTDDGLETHTIQDIELGTGNLLRNK